MSRAVWISAHKAGRAGHCPPRRADLRNDRDACRRARCWNFRQRGERRKGLTWKTSSWSRNFIILATSFSDEFSFIFLQMYTVDVAPLVLVSRSYFIFYFYFLNWEERAI